MSTIESRLFHQAIEEFPEQTFDLLGKLLNRARQNRDREAILSIRSYISHFNESAPNGNGKSWCSSTLALVETVMSDEFLALLLQHTDPTEKKAASSSSQTSAVPHMPSIPMAKQEFPSLHPDYIPTLSVPSIKSLHKHIPTLPVSSSDAIAPTISSDPLHKRILIFDTSMLFTSSQFPKDMRTFLDHIALSVSNSSSSSSSSFSFAPPIVDYVNTWIVEMRYSFTVGILLFKTSHAAKQTLMQQKRIHYQLRGMTVWFHACQVTEKEILLLSQHSTMEEKSHLDQYKSLQQELKKATSRRRVIHLYDQSFLPEQEQHHQRYDPQSLLTQDVAFLSLARLYRQDVRVMISNASPKERSILMKDDIVRYFQDMKEVLFCTPVGDKGSYVIQFDSTDSSMAFLSQHPDPEHLLIPPSAPTDKQVSFMPAFTRLQRCYKEFFFDFQHGDTREKLLRRRERLGSSYREFSYPQLNSRGQRSRSRSRNGRKTRRSRSRRSCSRSRHQRSREPNTDSNQTSSSFLY